MRYTWCVQKPLKLKLPETIQVLLPTQKIYFYGVWLDDKGYLITQLKFVMKEQAASCFKQLRR